MFEPYDKKTEYGCYKTARLVIAGLKSMTGLPCDVREPKWNESINEYDDVAEFDTVSVGNHHTSLEIEAEELRIIVKGTSIDLIFA